MIFPRRLKIVGRYWRVSLKERVRYRGRDQSGVCHTDSRHIEVQEDTPLDELSTLIHECLHAIEAETGLNIPHHFVEKLERPIAELLVENPAILRLARRVRLARKKESAPT